MLRLSIKTGLAVVALCSTLAVCQQSETPQTREIPSARNPRSAAADMEVKKAMVEVESISSQIEALRNRITELSGLVAVTPESVRLLAEQLQSQRETMEIEEAGAEGRQQAIAMAIDKTSAQAKKRATTDETTAELEKVVEVRQKQVDRLRQGRGQGVVSNENVDAGEAALATARADVAASRQRALGTSGDTLDAWNRELMNLTIARKERAAKMEFIQGRLKALTPALDVARSLETRIHDLARAEKWLDSANDQMRILAGSGYR